jgi:hypothetical protein
MRLLAQNGFAPSKDVLQDLLGDACDLGNMPMLTALLHYGVEPTEDHLQRTVQLLHVTTMLPDNVKQYVFQHLVETVRLLLEHGAMPTSVQKDTVVRAFERIRILPNITESERATLKNTGRRILLLLLQYGAKTDLLSLSSLRGF